MVVAYYDSTDVDDESMLFVFMLSFYVSLPELEND